MSRVPIRLRLTAAFARGDGARAGGAPACSSTSGCEADLDESVTAGLDDPRRGGVAASGRRRRARRATPRRASRSCSPPTARCSTAPAASRRPALSRAELRAGRAAGDELERARARGGGHRADGPRPGADGAASGSWSSGSRSTTATRRWRGWWRRSRSAGRSRCVLASLLGYALAAAGLRPVEAMRRRAARGVARASDERLPLPAAHDEIRRLGRDAQRDARPPARSFERERRFVADASHELRTPVAVIKTELEGALRAGGHEPEVREALIAAVEECDHLAQLAEDLLVLARSGEGGCRSGPSRSTSASCSSGSRERFADRAPSAAATIRGRRRRRAPASRRTGCACARRSATSSTTRCATARATIVLRARTRRRRRGARGRRRRSRLRR